MDRTILTSFGCLGIVAGLALFGFGFVSVVGIVWGGRDGRCRRRYPGRPGGIRHLRRLGVRVFAGAEHASRCTAEGDAPGDVDAVDSAPVRSTFRAPPLRYTALEPRAILELGAFVAARPWLARAPRGDGRPVFVLPGFMAGDGSTLAMRRYLARLGHDTYGWEQGRNWGPSPATRAALRRRLLEIHRATGEPVAIVGWSLGGIYARHLAHVFADQVRQVVTLASPFRMSNGDRSRVSAAYQAAAGRHHADFTPLGGDFQLAVPATSIYSRTDGVVDWRACLDIPGPTAENVEVNASHFGMGHHPQALLVIADRLAQPPGEWAPFRAGTGNGVT